MVWQVNVAAVLICIIQLCTTSGKPTAAGGATPFSVSTDSSRESFSNKINKEELYTSDDTEINLQSDNSNESNIFYDPLDIKSTPEDDNTFENIESESISSSDDDFLPFSRSNEDSEFPDFSRLSSVSEPFNMEGSEIGDATFIVPDEPGAFKSALPTFELPRRTYALTVDDGQVTHKDIRKDNGEYTFSYTSTDGSSRKEVGRLVTAMNGQKVLTVKGSYSYSTPDGQKFRVDYQADTNGFRIINTTPAVSSNALSGGKPSVGNRPNNEPSGSNGFSWGNPTSRPNTQFGNNGFSWGQPTTGERPTTQIGTSTNRPMVQSGNNNGFNWGKPTNNKRPVNMKRPSAQIKPQIHQAFGGKPSGGGRPLVKPTFNIPVAGVLRPRPIRPQNSPGNLNSRYRLKPSSSVFL